MRLVVACAGLPLQAVERSGGFKHNVYRSAADVIFRGSGVHYLDGFQPVDRCGVEKLIKILQGHVVGLAINSIIFITVIAVVFGCNVFYLGRLYVSIRNTVEKDVMTALADADLDELWIRAERSRAASVGAEAQYQTPDSGRHGEASFTNRFIRTVGKQFHLIMDPYVPADMPVMDSVLTMRLNNRFIYPDFVAVEIVDGEGTTVQANAKLTDGDYAEFIYPFSPDEALAYKAYITPLTRHILSQMMGVIITVFLLIVVFAAAFVYLFRTVSRLRTIEEMKDDFVNNMTHELKTPISIAYAANDALLNYDTVNDQQKKTAYLAIAMKQLKRLGELVETILAVSMERRKTMTLKPERFSLTALACELAEAQRLRADKPISIEVDGADDVEVVADKAHVANVLNNLIDNAIKYSGERVDIRISVCVVPCATTRT